MKKLTVFAAFVAVTISILILSLTTSSCSQSEETAQAQDTALNITIYLDLSDRLVRDNTPLSQTELDTAIVACIAKKFKDVNLSPKLLKTRDHLKVMFYPVPKNKQIGVIASSLDVDLAQIDVKERKNKLKNIEADFKKGLEQIYSQTLQDPSWIGSDIWGFFDKGIVDQQCIKKDSRNILVILTDGYVYDKNNKRQNGNSYNYILPQNLAAMDSMIISRKGLENLEILVLEVNPYKEEQRDKMKSLLKNWFIGMGVRDSVLKVYYTSLPNDTRTNIKNFLKLDND